MTLGSIFEKLSTIRLRSIAKWYGMFVFYALVASLALIMLMGISLFVYTIVSGTPWWATAIIVVVATGLWAFSEYGEHSLNPERFLDSAIPSPDEGYQPLVGRRATEWEKIRNIVLEMGDGETCEIVLGGEKYFFESRDEALEFIERNYSSEVKTA